MQLIKTIFECIGALIVILAGGVVATLTVALSLLTGLAFPALCVVAIWGILKYFGVL